MLYRFRFNKAFYEIGLDPQKVSADMRLEARENGKARSLTPQEAVIVMVGRLPVPLQLALEHATVDRWLAHGKLRPIVPIVHHSLIALAWLQDIELA
jgi:hypothetical protein